MRIALLNDYDLVVAGLVAMLSAFDEVCVVDTSVTGVDIDRPVDVALYDTYGRSAMPWPETGDMTRDPNAHHTALYAFNFDDALVERAFASGVSAVLWKGLRAEQLVHALHRVAGGERVVSERDHPLREPDPAYRWPLADQGLSARESEVLALVTKGLTNRAIARTLYLGEQTIKSHLRQVYRKLGVHSRAEATARALTDPSFHAGHRG